VVTEPTVVKKQVEVMKSQVIEETDQALGNVPDTKEVEVAENVTKTEQIETVESHTYAKPVEATEYVFVQKDVNLPESVHLKKTMPYVESVITIEAIAEEIRESVVGKKNYYHS
jgi:hypothetical protein